jgi:hypothetical protein
MRDWMSHVRRLVLLIGCAAPALFIALVLYAKFFTEGWGAFGIAPLFFPLFVASAVAAVLGALLYIARARTRPRDFPLVGVVALNAVLLWCANTHR